MLNINYNHSSDNLTEAIGLTGDDVNYMKCAVVYSILNPKVFATSLFDKEEEIRAYIAGLFDGEGSHCIRNNGQKGIGISMTEKACIDFLKKNFKKNNYINIDESSIENLIL